MAASTGWIKDQQPSEEISTGCSKHRFGRGFMSAEEVLLSTPLHNAWSETALTSITDLPMRVAARGEVHAKVIRQDPVILDELGEGRLIGPPEPDLHSSLERHGRRYRVRVPGPQRKEASAG